MGEVLVTTETNADNYNETSLKRILSNPILLTVRYKKKLLLQKLQI
jgi:hypothetical protein